MIATMTTLATALGITGVSSDPVHFLISFLIMVCVIACVIILVRWLLALAGWAIPQPLLVVAGIVVFIICLLWLLNSTGVYRW